MSALRNTRKETKKTPIYF